MHSVPTTTGAARFCNVHRSTARLSLSLGLLLPGGARRLLQLMLLGFARGGASTRMQSITLFGCLCLPDGLSISWSQILPGSSKTNCYSCYCCSLLEPPPPTCQTSPACFYPVKVSVSWPQILPGGGKSLQLLLTAVPAHVASGSGTNS